MRIEERMIDYAQKYLESLGYETELHDDNDLYVHLLDGFHVLVSHCQLKEHATCWLESEMEGVKAS